MPKKFDTDSEPSEGHWVPHFNEDGQAIKAYFVPEPPLCPGCPICNRSPKGRLSRSVLRKMQARA